MIAKCDLNVIWIYWLCNGRMFSISFETFVKKKSQAYLVYLGNKIIPLYFSLNSIDFEMYFRPSWSDFNEVHYPLSLYCASFNFRHISVVTRNNTRGGWNRFCSRERSNLFYWYFFSRKWWNGQHEWLFDGNFETVSENILINSEKWSFCFHIDEFGIQK